jgi:hypothetical protein
MAAEEQFNMNQENQKLLADSRAQLDSIKGLIDKADRVLRRLKDSQ